MTRSRIPSILLALIATASSLFAGFASTDTYLAAVGRVPGQGGAQFYTTVWASNLTTAPQTLTFQFLKQGQANPSPASFQDTLQPGETKVYENVVETKLGLTNAIGAARVTSTGEIFVSERIYNQAPGDDVGKTEGLFFAGVPKSFSISAGQSASIQGIDQGGSENFRYNFALIETGGGNPTVSVQVFDGGGTMLGQKAYALLPYEQIQPNVTDVVASIHTTNARITATVTGGAGSVLLAGAQLANESQDSSGFEMTFRDSLLGTSGGTAGVTSLNGLTGALTLTPGSGISITPSGNSISIAYTGGGGSGITAVTHDASLAGSGTGASPLSIASGQVVRSVNGLHDNLTLAAGSNVTITPTGSTLTIAASGGALTLPFAGSTNGAGSAFSVTNNGGTALSGTGTVVGVSASSGSGTGVFGESSSGDGVHGYSVYGNAVSGEGVSGNGVYGTSASADGIHGLVNNSAAGVAGLNNGSGAGVYGSSIGGYGVFGTGEGGWGVYGSQAGGFGATAGVNSGNGPGIYAESSSGSGIFATSTTGNAGYFAGDVTYTGSLIHSSDARFKDNVAPIPEALEGVLRLRGVTFDWRHAQFPGQHFPASKGIGFIAQEVETVFPSLVSTGGDGFKGVDYADLTPILVEAIKAQQRQIIDQQQLITDLTKRLGIMEAAIRKDASGAHEVVRSAASDGHARSGLRGREAGGGE
jgi:hypothetical protein